MPSRVIAFDADVLVYSAEPGNQLGQTVASLLKEDSNEKRLVGSVLLIPELLLKPLPTGRGDEIETLAAHLSYLELLQLDARVAELATSLGAAYSLKTVDAVHLATAVRAGADQFMTNNRKDFDRAKVIELEVTYPSRHE